MLGMDERSLGKHGLKTKDFAGYIPVSGQTVTHFTIRKERGIDRNTTVVDEAAPLYFVSKDIPPMLILTADNEMASRVEENQLLLANLKAAGNKTTKMKIIPNRDHNSVSTKMPEKDDPARAAMLEFIRSVER
jgi:acetyl esterase/lipase